MGLIEVFLYTSSISLYVSLIIFSLFYMGNVGWISILFYMSFFILLSMLLMVLRLAFKPCLPIKYLLSPIQIIIPYNHINTGKGPLGPFISHNGFAGIAGQAAFRHLSKIRDQNFLPPARSFF